MPKRGARLSFSWGRLPGNHGRKRSFSECALVSKSYRAPRFNVSLLLTFQSSCSQPAKRCRTTLYRCSVSEVEWKTKRVIEASCARFQVEASSNREERLQIRRWSCTIGPDLTVTSQTPAKLVVVSHVL